MVENLDAEQIWAEIMFLNQPLLKHLKTRVNEVLNTKIELADDVSGEEEEDNVEEIMSEASSMSGSYDEEGMVLDEGSFDEELGDEEEEEGQDEVEEDDEAQQHNREQKDFFNMEEMEAFVQDAEGRQANPDAVEDDVQDLIDDAKGEWDGEAGKIGYGEFFGDDDEENVGGMDEFSFVEEDAEGQAEHGTDQELLSLFERRAKEVEAQIKEIEDERMEEKHWALKGEVTVQDRPDGSLLDSFVDFDMVGHGTPMVTAEYNSRLEAVVKKRLLEGTFDDVIRKQEMLTNKFKPKIQLEFQKSEKGLGEIFEDAYLKALGEVTGGKKEEELPAYQREAQALFRDLCRSLDALTNDHYKPSVPKVKDISVNKEVAAIALEEVAPVGVSGAHLLAPEEIGGRVKSVVQKSDKEMEHEDRKKQRRVRKEQAKKREREKEAKIKARAAVDPAFAEKLRQQKEVAAVGKMAGTAVAKSDTGGGTKAGKEYTQSTKFFAALQDEADGKVKEKKKKQKVDSASQYKL